MVKEKDIYNYEYDALQQLTAEVLETIADFKKKNDDILVRFTIEVKSRDREEEEEPKNKKRKKNR